MTTNPNRSLPVTEVMIAAAARTYAEQEGYDWPDVSTFWQQRYRKLAAAALSSALAVHARGQLSHDQVQVHAAVEGGRPLVCLMGFDLAADDAERLGVKLVDEARAATREAAAWTAQGGAR